ncbi:MAG TPA: carboxylating nicotinate-nucleotide diphosphorylase [bacterium]|nr:carboxylating nicotinate-nucleotide diphosphorylase [bacterium]HPN43285.1 carboxylating nicotinate-nucleotide diphosphorylase [bacterium]
MDKILLDSAHALIRQALAEDMGSRGDITTLAICPVQKVMMAKIIAKQNGVIAGGGIAAQVFTILDPAITVQILIQDGVEVNSQDTIISITGPAASILQAERTALNFLGRLSGIATMTSQFTEQIKNSRARILDTRKTIPGMRLLEKYAVKCGGGENHRLGLYDMFLIKDNHIASAGSITTAVRACRNYMQKHNFTAEIEVETRNLAEVQEALDLHVDRIMLDNMSTTQMRDCVELVGDRIPLEASGNVTLDRIAAIAATGVDYISIGALTHSAPNFDVSLLFVE